MRYEQLETLVNEGKSIAEISDSVGKGKTAVRHWLKKYNLKTTGKAGGKVKYAEKDGKKVCTKCRTEKPLSEFRERKDRLGTLQPHCKSCDTKRVVKQQHIHKDALVKYMGGKCADCGIVGDSKIYDFHHLEPEHKDFTIQEHRGYSFIKITSELNKCVLLCSNCHVKRHLDMKLEEGFTNKIEGNTERFREVRKQKLDYACDGEPKCSKCGYDECESALLISYADEDKKYVKYNRKKENWSEDFTRALKSASIVGKNCFRS